MVKKWKDSWTKSTLLGLGLGQLLSPLITFTGFTSSQLAMKGIYALCSQCFLSYLLLALVYGGIMLYRGQPLKAKLYYYINLAVVDVVAKMSVIMAYRYASLTSVMLLDCWTIPCVMLVSWFFLKTIYGSQKLVGVAICVAGLATVVLSDIILMIGHEIFVNKADRVELMAMLGIFGAIFTALQIPTNEFNDFKSILSSPGTIFTFIGFSIAMFLFYSGFPFLLKVDWIYFVAFAVVTLGLIVYSWEDEVDPNNGEPAAIDEVGLGHSNNVGISNNGEFKLSFRGARNSLCYTSGIIRIHRL